MGSVHASLETDPQHSGNHCTEENHLFPDWLLEVIPWPVGQKLLAVTLVACTLHIQRRTKIWNNFISWLTRFSLWPSAVVTQCLHGSCRLVWKLLELCGTSKKHKVKVAPFKMCWLQQNFYFEAKWVSSLASSWQVVRKCLQTSCCLLYKIQLATNAVTSRFLGKLAFFLSDWWLYRIQYGGNLMINLSRTLETLTLI